MSSFITRDDYKGVIRDNRLDTVTEYDDTKLAQSEERAIGFVKSYLSARYDVAAIFSAVGEDRDIFILNLTIDVALYYLHRMANPRKVPEFRKEAYDEAKEWLEAVQAGERNPVGLPVPEDGSKSYLTYGSNPKRTNHI